jgi:uncharacterized membrane protein YwaF
VQQDFMIGVISIGLFMAPLIAILCVFNLVYVFRAGSAGIAEHEPDLTRINFEIAKYLVFLLALPACVLISTVIIAYARDFSAVLNSILWTLLGLGIVLTWGCYRLVRLVSMKTQLQWALDSG